MPGYPLFHAFSDLAITGPGKSIVFQKLSKLMIIHKAKLKPAAAVIQANKFRGRVRKPWSSAVPERWGVGKIKGVTGQIGYFLLPVQKTLHENAGPGNKGLLWKRKLPYGHLID